MENKYFTPNIEDLRIGYELEYSDTHDEWIKFTISNVEDLIDSFTAFIRVPYLTQTHLEERGWIHRYNDFTFGEFYRSENNELNYHINYDYSIHYLTIGLYNKEDTTTFGDIYNGECKDPNTFNYICKLLNIE